MNGLLPPSNMGVLRGEWRVHACELDDVALVQESLEWLSGIDGCVKWVEEKSFHGPLLITGIVKLERKKLARECLKRLGRETLLELISDGLERRVDEDKNLHLRVSLSRLVKGEVRLCSKGRSEAFVKGIFKIEAYPGDDHIVVITDLLRSMA